MSNPQEPKKPNRPKSRRLNLNSKEKWEKLLKEVSKEQVPVTVLRNLTVNLKDGTTVDVNVEDLLKEGVDPEHLEKIINDKLNQLDIYIKDVDFHISVDSVAKTVQPYTDKILKDL
jgi:hypothetical protein